MLDKNFSGLPRRIEVVLGSTLNVEQVDAKLRRVVVALRRRHAKPWQIYVGQRTAHGWHIVSREAIWHFFKPPRFIPHSPKFFPSFDVAIVDEDGCTDIHVVMKPASYYEGLVAFAFIGIPLVTLVTFLIIFVTHEGGLNHVLLGILAEVAIIGAIGLWFKRSRRRFEAMFEREIETLRQVLGAFRLDEIREIERDIKYKPLA